jgi:hypothetical protein
MPESVAAHLKWLVCFIIGDLFLPASALANLVRRGHGRLWWHHLFLFRFVVVVDGFIILVLVSLGDKMFGSFFLVCIHGQAYH